MFHDILFLAMGLVLLVLGGSWVTDGSVAIARKMHVSGLVIGLTVVAFGSSVPDLSVCLNSTFQHKSQLALGDVVGAGIFDMLLAVGLTVLIKPVLVDRISLRGTLPLTMVAAAVLFVCADDVLVDGAARDVLDRSDGIVMLLIFAIFMAYTLMSARVEKAENGAQSDADLHKKQIKPLFAAGMIVVGLGALTIGGNWIVDGASGLAVKAGMSEALVGLTIVAVGSSLPDAATSIIAARKGESGIAMGNLIGSCIFDILFVLGTCSVISPLNCGQITFADYGTMLVASILLMAFALFGRKHTLRRPMGALLTLMYVGYIVYLCIAK